MARSKGRSPTQPDVSVRMTKPASPQDAARRDRLRAALRENLKRRKAQAKARAAGGGNDAEDPGDGEATDAPRSADET